MKYFTFGSISKHLALLIILAASPALAILFYSGLEQREQSIRNAKQDIVLRVHAMAEAQKEITSSTRQILSTLSLLPAFQAQDIPACSIILETVLRQNPQYNNITLVDLNGDVLAAGKEFSETNLADRRHVQEAISRKKFAVGEYILSRVGTTIPAFPFAYPVVSQDGVLVAVVTSAVKLTSFNHFHDSVPLPEKSFIALTDHQGVRLFYYPPQGQTNPIGKKILQKNWQIADNARKPTIFTSTGADGERRIFAIDEVRLTAEDPPYLYLWAGIPEDHVTGPANAILARNMLLMVLATLVSLCLTWLVGKKTLIVPIKQLVDLARKFGRGDLNARCEILPRTRELQLLTTAFHEMAGTLAVSQESLRENESRFRLLLNSLDASVFVIDMNCHEIIFVNEHAKKLSGDITGRICWQCMQKGQNGPCRFCTNKYLLTADGEPGELYKSEFHDPVTGRWLFMHNRAIKWNDGRIVRLQVTTDFTERKNIEEEREKLIGQLQEALAEIKTLSGFLPICASCKKIRDDKGYWNQIETYIQNHSEAEFSHSICPDCARKLYPELYPEDKAP